MAVAKALEALLQAETAQGYFTAYFVECGRLDESRPVFSQSNVPSDALFDLASLSKALATGPLVHQQFDQGKAKADDSLERWNIALPDRFLPLTLQELLAHRSGLPAWWNFWMGRLHPGKTPSPERANPLIRRVFERITFVEGKPDLYSDLGYILLGYWLEEASGRSLADLFQSYRDTSLGLPQAAIGFAPNLKMPREAFIPSAVCKLRDRLLQGEVHDENCAALGGVAGHAGLFGSGSALAAFLKALYASPLGANYLRRNEEQSGLHPFEGLSGLRRGSGTSAVPFHEGKGMGHLGFTGTAFWLHLPSREYVIFLSNRVISGRVSPRMTEVRRSVMESLNALLRG